MQVDACPNCCAGKNRRMNVVAGLIEEEDGIYTHPSVKTKKG
jgi:hypothetical protein